MGKWMEKTPSARVTFFLLFLFSLLVLLWDASIQARVHIESCPMDFVERMALFVFGFVCFIGALQPQTIFSKKIYSAICFILACLGAFVSARHWWIQGLSTAQLAHYVDVPVDNLSYLSLGQILCDGLKGTRECVVAYWETGGITTAGWFLLVNVVLAVLSLYQYAREKL